MSKSLKVTAAAGGSPPTIYIYDEIGPAWAGMIGAETLVEALKQIGQTDEIDVRLNTPGGSVFEAVAMYNQLIEHPARITIRVDGQAASAGSLIAMAGDMIYIASNAAFMVHEASTFGYGNKHELRKTGDLLDQVDTMLIDTYAKRTGQKPEQITQWLEAETWLFAEDAKKYGFADEITGTVKNATIRVPMGRFKNVPEGKGIEVYEPDSPKVTLAKPPEPPERQTSRVAGRGHSAAYVAARVAGVRSRIGF